MSKIFDTLVSIFNSNRKISYLGTIELEVLTSKEVQITVETTNRRVEKGFVIADTSRVQPEVINIEVVDNSSSYLINKEELQKLVKLGEPTTFIYSDGTEYQDVIVTSFREIYKAEQQKGRTYSMTIQKVIQAEKVKETFSIKEEAKIPVGNSTKTATQIEVTDQGEINKVEEVKKKSGLLSLVGG